MAKEKHDVTGIDSIAKTDKVTKPIVEPEIITEIVTKRYKFQADKNAPKWLKDLIGKIENPILIAMNLDSKQANALRGIGYKLKEAK